MPIISQLPSRVFDRRPLTPTMLAERWQCSERHVRNLIAKGDLRAFKLGGKLLRIAYDAIEEYEQRSVRGPLEEAVGPDPSRIANRAARLARMSRA